jgi:hypothetical protein
MDGHPAAGTVAPFTAALKYADYRADGFATDTGKFWVQVEYAH